MNQTQKLMSLLSQKSANQSDMNFVNLSELRDLNKERQERVRVQEIEVEVSARLCRCVKA